MRKYSHVSPDTSSSLISSTNTRHHHYSSGFAMARAFQTASPDVSREQARYRRLMQISSARSFDVAREGHRDSLSSITETNLTEDGDSGSLLHRPSTMQQWPRKLEPLPGRFASSYADKETPGSRISPVQKNNSRNSLSPDDINTEDKHHIKHRKTRRLHSVPSEDEETQDVEERSRSNTCPDIPPLLPASDSDSNNNPKSQSERSTWSPLCLGAAQVAALTPVNVSPPQNQTQPLVTVSPPDSGIASLDKSTAAAAAFASTIATATVHASRPNVRRPKRLTPMTHGESSPQEEAK